jgi:serine/threonine-protein kinase
VPQNARADSAQPSGKSSSQWNDEILDSLERSLVRYIGPMARVLVRKQSRTTNSLEELVSSLCRHIPNDNERTQFIKSVEKFGLNPKTSQVSSGNKPAPPPAAQPAVAASTMERPRLTDAARDRISQLLAFYLGPLASRLLQKAMKTSVEPTALIAQLAHHIPDEKERKQFIEQATRAL